VPSKLTDVAIRNAKSGPKAKRLFDGGGLYLEISPSGSKLWRLKYRFGGKEKRLALGIYPTITLAEARERRDDARKLLAHGEDPSAAKKAVQAEIVANSETFLVVANEWFGKYKGKLSQSSADDILRRLELNIYPFIGNRPIREITTRELNIVIERMVKRGAIETARRQIQKCNQIFRYAIATGRLTTNPAEVLRGSVPPVRENHFASIHDPKGIGALLRDIDNYQGTFVVCCALKLAPLTFVRPGELRGMEWSEVNFDKALWTIPERRMKMGATHLVPLSRQALAILRELHQLTGQWTYAFPGARTKTRCMSENTVNAALRRLGYTSKEMTGHGFRSQAFTTLALNDWDKDHLNVQLAHSKGSKTQRAYDFAKYLRQRKVLMQAWADHLDELRAGNINADCTPPAAFHHA